MLTNAHAFNEDETLRLVKAFKFVDAHGDQVCPANWEPGNDTMNPDPEGELI